MEEENIRNLSEWSGTGSVSGVGDAEIISLETGQYMESESWKLGSGWCAITIDKYDSGVGSYTVEYKTGDSLVNCEADAWNNYIGPFDSLGWVKVKVSK